MAGFQEKWEPDPKKATAKGNSAQRMLEACSTVEEAVAFYEKHHEPFGRVVPESPPSSPGHGLKLPVRGIAKTSENLAVLWE